LAYDNLNRLISATLGSTAIQYSYDATGNRTTKVISGTSYPNIHLRH
jgi:YD repeat-containing protein